MSIILGINKDHSDSSACLLINGNLIGAVAEERLGNRVKHDSSFPNNSIEWLINLANIKYSDIDIVAVSNNSLSNLAQRFIHSFDFSKLNLIKKIKNKIYNRTSVKEKLYHLCKKNGENVKRLKFKILNYEHHLTHIASAYYLSSFTDRTATLVMMVQVMLLVHIVECENNKIKVLEEFLLKV